MRTFLPTAALVVAASTVAGQGLRPPIAAGWEAYIVATEARVSRERGEAIPRRPDVERGEVFIEQDKVVVALPGPPRELQPIVRDELVPYLSRRFGTRLPGSSLTIRFVGPGQSQIAQTMKEHAPLSPDVLVSSQFEGGRVDFTFSLPDDNAENRSRLEALKQKTAECLGDYIYAYDETTTLEQHVLALVAEAERLLASGARFYQDVWAPSNRPADLSGAHLDEGRVHVHPGFHDIYRRTTRL